MLRKTLIFVLPAIFAPSALADVETAAWSGPNQFIYEISHMPDLDQRRDAASGIPGLPGKGGMYCVPTSTVNMMAYIANHGFPGVMPGPGFWQGSSKYNDATAAIDLMGAFMGTSATGGTGGNGWYTGAWVWLLPSGKFVTNLYGASGTYSPTQASMTQTAMNGAIVSFAYGRYKKVGTYLGLPLLDRDGGHAVTLSRSMASGAARKIFCRDPADPNDGMLWDQSWFGDRMLDAQDQVVATGPSIYQIKKMTALNYDAGNSKHAYIDGYLAIRPKSGYSFKPGSSGGGWTFQLFSPFTLKGHPLPSEAVVDITSEIVDAVIGPDWNKVYALVSADGSVKKLTEVDLLTGDQKVLLDVVGAKAIQFGRHRDVHVLTSTKLLHFDLGDEIKPAEFNLPYPCDAISYDDEADQVIALSVGAQKVLKIDQGIWGDPHVFSIPSAVPMSGDGSVIVNPVDGKVYFWTDKTPTLFKLDVAVTGGVIVDAIQLPAVQSPTSFEFDDQGHLFAVENGRTTEFAPSGEKWVVAADQPWAAYVTGERFKVFRSRTNWTPDMDEVGPQHVDPSELDDLVDGEFIPDCDTDAANTEYGQGKAGTNGVPRLTSTDLPYVGATSAIRLENALPGAIPTLVLGVQAVSLPFDGGTLLASPNIVLTLPAPVAPDGTLTISGKIPADPGLCGVDIFHQFLIPDPAATGFYKLALTNGLRRTLGS